MKINELQLSKDVKKYDNNPEKILSKNGWKVIGDGVESAVAEHPNKSYVLKLFYTRSRYVDFVKFAQEHQSNKHLPRFGRYVRPVPGSIFSYVRMEKLKPILTSKLLSDYFPEIVAVFLKFNGFGKGSGATWFENIVKKKFDNELGLGWDTNKIQELWDNIGKHVDSHWLSLLDELKSLNINVDFHDENFMLRGKTLVIIDPFI